VGGVPFGRTKNVFYLFDTPEESELTAPIVQPIGQDFWHPRFGFGESFFLVIPIPEQLSGPIFEKSNFGGKHPDGDMVIGYDVLYLH
jgi:hypothetical protein